MFFFTRAFLDPMFTFINIKHLMTDFNTCQNMWTCPFKALDYTARMLMLVLGYAWRISHNAQFRMTRLQSWTMHIFWPFSTLLQAKHKLYNFIVGFRSFLRCYRLQPGSITVFSCTFFLVKLYLPRCRRCLYTNFILVFTIEHP